MRRTLAAVLLATSGLLATTAPAFAAVSDPATVWSWCGHGVC